MFRYLFRYSFQVFQIPIQLWIGFGSYLFHGYNFYLIHSNSEFWIHIFCPCLIVIRQSLALDFPSCVSLVGITTKTNYCMYYKTKPRITIIAYISNTCIYITSQNITHTPNEYTPSNLAVSVLLSR